MLLKISWKAQ